jgi:predicted restriction endonuclease
MLQKKELKNKITKKNLQITNLNKEKLERAISLSDKLEGKILKSKQRAKMVQTARKSNWESINSSAVDTLQPKNDETVEQPQEDEMTEDIYEEEAKQPKVTNAFALLDEVEC